MTDDAIERRLQDYLDGRMDAEERSAFEALLQERPDLELRARSAHEVGAALREEVPLPPGFHDRARRRFEAARAERPRGFRLVSWEAAGLAAAAVFVFALFLPQFWRDEREKPRERPVAAASQDVTEPLRPELEDDAPPEKKLKADKQAAAKPEPVAAPPPPPAPAAPAATAAPTANEERRLAAEARADGPAAQAPVAGATARARSAPSSMGEFAPAPPAAGRDTVELPAGLVAPGALRIVDDRPTWEALLSGEAGAALGALGPAEPELRLVLIGGRDDVVGCDAYSIARNGEAWELRYRAEPLGKRRARGAGGGCALVLPRDGRIVRVVGTP